ncbi:MAG: patatin-like phospholipase family protein [Planctomycetota bacterium]
MTTTAYTEDPRVLAAIERLNAGWNDRAISDIVDGEDHQYVDLVMEGGGVLGIALVGYTYALEHAGIRFLGVGGTSAGAINATMVAALDRPSKPKSGKLLDLLGALDMFTFVDGDGDARDFVESLVEGAGPVKLGFKAVQVIDNLRDDLGLNPGHVFRRWVKGVLAEAGIDTVADLEARMRDLPADLQRRDGTPVSVEEAAPKLAIIAADISTETRVEFPDMADLYFADPKGVNPARMVRASMSIPAFFEPLKVRNVPRDPGARARWADKAGYHGKLPREVCFVDGGIMSNFPIDVFHAPGVPAAPTLGVKLGTERAKPNRVKRPLQLLGAVFNSARHTLDYEFIRRNPDYRNLVAFIPTGDHNWLNFFMKRKDKVDLFRRGVETAVDFLLSFDWEAYKTQRATMA